MLTLSFVVLTRTDLAARASERVFLESHLISGWDGDIMTSDPW